MSEKPSKPNPEIPVENPMDVPPLPDSYEPSQDDSTENEPANEPPKKPG